MPIFTEELQMKNLLKRKLHTGKHSIGTWICIGHPDVTEMLARAGFDWLLLDMEHAPLSVETMHHLIQAMGGGPAAALVRVASKDPVLIGQALDAGADGVMIPLVNTAEDARNAVAACYYPPQGTRGVGPRRAADYGRRFVPYMKTANHQVVVVVQIETPETVRNIDEILSVPGIHVAAIGPGDLSMTMGCFHRREDPDFQRALNRVRDACRRHGVVPGMAYVSKSEQARKFIKRGFPFVGLGTDDEFLCGGAATALAGLKAKRS